jgi:hypothetical protein
MSLSTNAQVEFEAGQTLVPVTALTDSGDHLNFTHAFKPWSRKSGFDALITPNGLVTGGAVTAAAGGGNNNVDVAALSCYLAGVLTSVSAATNQAITRPATAVSKVNSITVTSAGAVAVVAGTDGASTAFSETRGAAGGPPLIPVGSVEIAQVRVISNTAAPIAAAEIFAVVGTHVERYDFPAWSINPFDGKVTFASALPVSHTGSLAKGVYAKIYTPIFQAVAKALDFAPCETTYSAGSQEYYGGTLGTASSSLGQGSFTALLEDGHTDSLLSQKGQNILVRFKQDRNRTPYSLTQGILGVTRTYPKTQQVQAACTLTCELATQDYSS